MNIEELTTLDELHELVQLFATVWSSASDPPLNPDTLRAMSHSGCYIAGARSDGGLAGGIVGWLGMHEGGAVHVHSHILGVLPGVEARGLGFALKQHQRTWCLERGIKTIEWTFDPLIGRNAYFNLNKLGAEAADYLVDFYGSMSDGINAGDESDRILVRWALESDRAVAAAHGRSSPEPDLDRATRMLRVGDGGEPAIARVDSWPAICEVPDDIVAIRRARPDLARSWRRALRDTLGAHLMSGGRVDAVTRRGAYVLEHRRV